MNHVLDARHGSDYKVGLTLQYNSVTLATKLNDNPTNLAITITITVMLYVAHINNIIDIIFYFL